MNELIITCKVIEDLMPLYADGICSEDTKTVVEHHTAECPECRKKLADMTAELEKKAEPTSPKENPFKKVRRHYTKLIVVTLCICAAVMIPAAVLFRMYVNDAMDQKGVSFSTVAVWNGLRDVGKMLKRGEYLKLLTSSQAYFEDHYTAEEAAVIKKAMAEDMEQFFGKYPIKKIKSEPGLGKTEDGVLQLTLDMGNGEEADCVINCTFDGSDLIGMDGFYFSDDGVLIKGDPPVLTFIDKDSAERIMGNLSSKATVSEIMLWFLTEEVENIYGGLGKFTDPNCMEIRSVYSKKAYAMLDKYSYIGCEGGEVTYTEGGRFSQRAALTMTSAESGEFTAEFDMPLFDSYVFTHFENVSYSDNTPEDFKTMFEEIFVSREPVREQYELSTVSDGKFYLNGDRESCYYIIENGTALFVLENEKQARELYEADGSSLPFERYIEFAEAWKEPIEFTVELSFSDTRLSLSPPLEWCGDNGGSVVYPCFASVIDSDNIYMGDGAIFTRLDDE